MAMNKGIFCLEGAWDQNRDLTNRLSVEQQLRMFEGARICDVIHRDVATRPEFEHYLKEWLKKKYVKYPLGYLAFHGTQGSLSIGDTGVTLEELADIIGPGKACDRILYFGSCSTMAAPEAELRTFCQKTGAKAIVGYTRRVDWMESAAFDCLLLPRLLKAISVKPVFTSLEKDYPSFVRRLGLRIATAKWATGRRIAEAVAPSLAA
jgi:hypothetical protein